MKKHLKKGFTLIELLVVVAIIAILALIVLLALNPVEMARRSRDSQRLSDLGTIRRAIDLALADKQSLEATSDFTDLTNSDVTVTDFFGLNLGKYLSVIPMDPVYISEDNTDIQVVTTSCEAGTEKKGNMSYEFMNDGNVYVLRAKLESTENCDAINRDGLVDGYFETGTAPGLTF